MPVFNTNTPRTRIQYRPQLGNKYSNSDTLFAESMTMKLLQHRHFLDTC